MGMAMESALTSAGFKVMIKNGSGSQENIAWINSSEGGNCEGNKPCIKLALVQNDSEGFGDETVLTSLYEEYAFVFVSEQYAESIRNLDELSSLKAISLGLRDSGARSTVGKLFNEMPNNLLEFENAKLAEGFTTGLIDAAILLSNPNSVLLQSLCRTPGVRLIGLGGEKNDQAKAMATSLLYPYIFAKELPMYLCASHPRKNIHTVGVKTLLVSSRFANKKIITDIMETLFSGRVKMAKKFHLAGAIQEGSQQESLAFPFHDGAHAYYNRRAPGFIVRYAEVFALVLTVLFGLSTIIPVINKGISRFRKERIDIYYQDIKNIVENTDRSSSRKVESLLQLRSRAFEDLIREKLAADDSFSIFLDYLNAELERFKYDGKN